MCLYIVSASKNKMWHMLNEKVSEILVITEMRLHTVQ